MSVESVARDFIKNMADQKKAIASLTPDAMVDGGVLPRPMPAMETFKIMQGLSNAMPDLTFDIKQVDVNGNIATVKARWSGTQTGPLNLGVPGMPEIPATGKHVSVDDKYVVSVKDNKVSHMTVDSPMDGGIPGALSQLGFDMPDMPKM